MSKSIQIYLNVLADNLTQTEIDVTKGSVWTRRWCLFMMCRQQLCQRNVFKKYVFVSWINTTEKTLFEKIDSHTLLLKSCAISSYFESTISDCSVASILYTLCLIHSKNHAANKGKMADRCQYGTHLTRIGLNNHLFFVPKSH